MKKIVLFWPYFLPDPGAAAIRGWAFKERLEEEFLVMVITGNKNKLLVYSNALEVRQLKSGAPWFFLKTLRDWRPDVVLVSYPGNYWLWRGWLAARLTGAIFYLDCRDLPMNKRWLFRFISKRAKIIFSVTATMTKELVETHGLKAQQVCLLPNGADQRLFERILPTLNKKIDVIFLGRLNFERDPLALIELVKELKLLGFERIKFVGIDLKYQSALEWVRIMNVDFLPESNRSRVIEELALAKIGLVSVADDRRLDYQLPVKVFEYLAAGLPVAALVSDNNIELRRFMLENNSGVIANRPKELAQLIEGLLMDKPRLFKIGQRNKLLAEKFERRTILKNLSQYFK